MLRRETYSRYIEAPSKRFDPVFPALGRRRQDRDDGVEMATIADVAQAAGVSISTVSYALSGKRSITQATRERVLAAAQELGYLPHASARMLAANRSHIIAVSEPVHPDTDDAAHMSFAMETTKVARSHNYDTLLLVHDDALAGMRRSAATQLADGIVVLDVDEDDARVPLARTLACPTVFVGLPADTEGLLCVDLDFEAAARTAIDRLVETGHRQIGLISHRRETLDRGSNFPAASCARSRTTPPYSASRSRSRTRAATRHREACAACASGCPSSTRSCSTRPPTSPPP
ncbi:hypothetical protein GCM10025873_19770 [Demequina sediminis]|nr:hypothetical protein GCM10025873_19770 [Demequina sediminis]